MVVASRERARTAKELRAAGKPVLLAQASIHAGEMDGKDAGLMLLRDMTVRGARRDLLENANVLFVPILNVDGHERFSAFTRINQRGPDEAGWRTNARNLNLNHDFSKLDTPEVRAVVAALERWSPDLYLDLHVTDGWDHQYDVTFGANEGSGWSPAIARWSAESFKPALAADLREMGHTPGPLEVANVADAFDLRKGIVAWVGGPRFSIAYGDARHLPSMLVEMHSLKSYERRVLGQYVLLESALRHLARDASGLRAAMEQDRRRRAEQVAVDFGPGSHPPTETIEYQGVETRVEPSPVSGARRVVFTGRPLSLKVPVARAAPTVSVSELENEIATLQTQLAEINDQLSATNNQVRETNNRMDELEKSIGAHTASLEKLAAMQTALETQINENNDKALLAMNHEIILTRTLEMLACARLYLAQSNFGLAKVDIQSARDLLGELNAEAGQEDFAQAISRLDLALGNLPAFPVVASGDIEIAWQILMTGETIATTTPESIASGTPVPEPKFDTTAIVTATP